MRREGYTLVEVMIVLAILAIGATLSFAYLGHGRARASLAGATQEVRMALATARSAAIAGDREVRFDGDAGGYRVDGAPHAFAEAGLDVEVRGAPGIAFFPSGGSSGGRIVLRDGTMTREIEVEALTGRAVLVR